jgi:TolB-like protein/Tfp pilus assembly protein PilF
VLPFENMSDDDATDYFSDGLSEEILNSLAQIPRLRVAARTSSFYFKDRNADIAEIGAALKVQSVLEGSVRKEGSTLRVTAQLIDAASGYHLWSETFDRQDSDLLSVQTEIAEKVAAALQNRLLGSSGAFDRRSITVSVEAYDAYLYGKQELERRSAASLERAIESLLEAIEFDPEFAEAYTALAHAYLLQHYYSQRAAEEVYAAAIAALDRAQELDPDLPYARQIRGTAAIVAMDLAAAIGILNEAIEATPNDAGSWRSLGFAHVLNGDLKLAEIAYETANDLDPLNATLLYNVGAVQMLRGNFDRGAAIFERVAAISPDQRASTKRYLSGWAGRYGRYEEAAVTLTEAQGVSPSEALFARVRLLIDLGLWDEAELRLEQSSVIADYEPVTETGKILLRQGRYSELDERFGARNAVFTDDDGAGALLPQMRQRHFWRGMAKLVAGRYGEAQEAFLAAAGEPAELSLSDIEYLPHLAYAYQLDGKDASADEILRIGDELVVKAMQQGWNTPSFKMKTARLLSVQGDTVAAVDELRAAVEQGWLVAGDLDHDPIWQPLRDDPDFIDLVAEVERRLEPMRSNVLRTLDEAQYRSRVHSQ